MADDDNGKFKAWWERFPWSPVLALGVQTIGVVIVVVQMRSDIQSIKDDVAALDRKTAELDAGGSKALAVLQARGDIANSERAMQGKRIDHIEAMDTENQRAINEVNLLTAREMPRTQGQIDSLGARLKSLEETVGARTTIINRLEEAQNTFSPYQQQVINSIKSDIARIEERQNRVVQALDQTYNLINEHMRAPGNPHNPTMPPLGPREKR